MESQKKGKRKPVKHKAAQRETKNQPEDEMQPFLPSDASTTAADVDVDGRLMKGSKGRTKVSGALGSVLPKGPTRLHQH